MHSLSLPRASTSTTSAGVGTLAVLAMPAAAVPWLLPEPWWIGLAVAATLLVAATAVTTDLIDRRIPDRVVLSAVIPTLLAVGARVTTGDAGAVLGVLLGAAFFACPLLIVHLIAPAAMGFGDVKLAAALGAALGLVDWHSALLALCLASAATAVAAIVRRRPSMPFAPGLVGGAALALLPLTFEGSLPWR